MVWDGEKIRDLRLRMGWSQSDLARRLQIDSQKVIQIENGLEQTPTNLAETLELLLRQADSSAEMIFCGSLAEIMFEEDEVPQVDTNSIRRKFLDL